MTRFALAAALLAAPAGAQAACADFQASSAQLDLTYDPYGNAEAERIFTVRIRRIDPSVTSVRLVFADPDPGVEARTLGRGGPADYQISWVQDGGRRVLVAGAEQPNATNGALVGFEPGPAGDIVTQTFRLRIPPGKDVGAGDYYQPLDIRYQCYSGSERLDGPDVQTGSQVAIDLNVLGRISTFIGSAGVRRGQIDFGVVAPGSGRTSGSLVVTAQSTVPYLVEIGTERHGLKRSDTDSYTLPYQLHFSGIPVDEDSRVTCARAPAPGGRQHLLQAEIDPREAARAPAGSYSDVVTLTFGPRLGLSGGEGCTLSSS
jgi:hypothetical protein